MSRYAAVDLSQLPPPDVVEPLDFETILSAMVAELSALAPDLAPALSIESEPLLKVLQVCAYRELLLRARVNDAARATMLATATGADLENLGALLGVSRLVVTPGDDEAVPPVAAVMEADPVFRQRIQLALEGFSTAGPRGAYLFHALSASGEVKDAAVLSPEPGIVQVAVLSNTGDGAASPALLETVEAALNAEDVRPLCDTVEVLAASIQTYAVTATLTVAEGPDPDVIEAQALAALQAYAAGVHRVGQAVRRSGIFAALHRPGVLQVVLTTPAADIVPPATGAAYCTGATLTMAAP
jgi:phage-related baseplate assembly protein